MKYEIYQDSTEPQNWRVEGFDNEAARYLAVFYGPEAKRRAKEYAAWKKEQPLIGYCGFSAASRSLIHLSIDSRLKRQSLPILNAGIR